jgi:xanthine dehydrogenase YagS FAD-binding subunit
MKAFRYDRPSTLAGAVASLAGERTLLKAAGIDVLDRMKERVDLPDRVVTLGDVAGLDRVERLPSGALRIGALATLARIAASEEVRAGAPALAQAASEAASPQIRNRATLGGNLGQHTRCGYYRLASFPCFKRGDAFCPVRSPDAVQEEAGIYGIDLCACAHPSSLAPTLGAIGATVVVTGVAGERRLAVADLYEGPRQGKASDMTLAPTDVIAAVEVPAPGPGDRQGFHEIRRRARFDWPLVLAAAWVRVEGEKVADARVWLGSVAPTPIASAPAHKALVGAPAAGAGFAAAAAAAGEAAAAAATPLPGTAYKTELVKVAVRRALVGSTDGRR